MTARSVYRALTVAAVIIISTMQAQARGEGEAGDGRTRTVVGSWLDTVSVAGGPTFKSLSTFTADGGWVMHDQGSVTTETPFPHVFSSGHGVWVRKGRRTFSLTALQILSDLKGDLLFLNRIRQTLTLNEAGDAYRTEWSADFTDPAGNQVFVFAGTTEGRRITVQPLP